MNLSLKRQSLLLGMILGVGSAVAAETQTSVAGGLSKLYQWTESDLNEVVNPSFEAAPRRIAPGLGASSSETLGVQWSEQPLWLDEPASLLQPPVEAHPVRTSATRPEAGLVHASRLGASERRRSQSRRGGRPSHSARRQAS